jgi:hypothetical protein
MIFFFVMPFASMRRETTTSAFLIPIQAADFRHPVPDMPVFGVYCTILMFAIACFLRFAEN